MSLINTKIKPFKNQAFKNGEFIEITEKDTEGRWSVFFFYPADFTFVCPTELGDVADHYELQKLGVDVYAVSTDTHFTHKAWHSSSETIAKIKYAMIGDPTGALTRNFDNMREDEGLADRARPSLLTRRGIIEAIRVTAEGIGRDASDLLRKSKQHQYGSFSPGEVCPAKWKEGEATLAPSLDLVGKI